MFLLNGTGGSWRQFRAMFLLSAIFLLLFGTPLCSSTDLSIGLILDESDSELEQAFEFAMMVLNNDHDFLQSFRPRMVIKTVVRNRTILADNYKLGSAICSLIDKGVMAIIGVSHPSSFNTIQSYSQALHVPYILASPSRSLPNDRYRYEMSISPPFEEIVLKLVELSAWEKIYYVYDSDDGLWRLQRLYQRFQTRPMMSRIVDAYRINNIYNAYELLRRLDYKEYTIETKRIVLDLSSTEAYSSILEQIIDMGMNRDNYHYILAGLGALDLNVTGYYSVFLHGGVNITGFSVLKRNSMEYELWQTKWQLHRRQYPKLFPLKTDAAMMIDAVQILHLAIPKAYREKGARGVFSSRWGSRQLGVKCRADHVVQLKTGEPLLQQLVQVHFRGLTGPVSFNRNGMRSDYVIDMNELSYMQPLTKVRTWTPEVVKKSSGKGLYSKNETVVNTTQKVATLLEPPFAMEKKDFINGETPIGPNDRYEGYCIDLIDLVAKDAKFEYTVLISDEYGRKNESGHWIGMVGELVRKTRDIAVAPLTITEERERVVDFSKPFMNTGLSIMIKKPDKQKPGVFSFMEPLDGMVWLCIGIGFLAVSFVLFFVGRFSPYEWNVNKNGRDESVANAFNISNTMWFSLGALMQQGSDISPRSLSGRIIGSAWWFFTLIIISSYTANLAAFLTIEKLLTPINSPDDLVEQSEIKYGTRAGGSSLKFFSDSDVPTYKRMYETMMAHKDEVLFKEVKDGVAKVRSSKAKYAFLLESSMNNYHSQQEPCDTMRVGNNLNNNGYGIATYIGYAHRDPINIAVLELLEIGELHKLEKKWWYDKGKCGDQDSSKDTSQSALTLSNVSGIFHILIGGLVLAMLTSSLEYLAQRKLKARKKKNKQKKLKLAQTPDRREFTPFHEVTAASPEHENGGYTFSQSGQLMTFEPATTSNQTEI